MVTLQVSEFEIVLINTVFIYIPIIIIIIIKPKRQCTLDISYTIYN